jgi:hypothetical protein
MIELTLVIVNEKSDISSEIQLLEKLAQTNRVDLFYSDSDEYQTTLSYKFVRDSDVIDFAEQALEKVPCSILSTIMREQ